MKKSKFIINNLKNLGKNKIIPTIAMMIMLNGNAMSLNKNEAEIPIERCVTTVSYEKASKEISEQKILNTLQTILKSDLRNMTSKDKSKFEIEEEIAKLTTELNANTLTLSEMYRAMENKTIDQSGSSLKKIYENNCYMTTKVDTQHYLHKLLTNLALTRMGMNHDVIHENTHLQNKTAAKSDVIEEINFYLNSFKNDICAFIFFRK